MKFSCGIINPGLLFSSCLKSSLLHFETVQKVCKLVCKLGRLGADVNDSVIELWDLNVSPPAHLHHRILIFIESKIFIFSTI